MRGLDDRVYVVTGGGGAIARPILQAFAGAGARLVVADRSVEIARAAADAVSGLALAVDLTRPEGGTELVRAAHEKWGRIDGLIHTVGGYASGSAYEGDPALYDRMFDLNVKTLWHAVRAVAPQLVERGGGFIAGFASEPAWNGAAPGSALYGAAKAAVANLLRTLDAELHGRGVRVAIVYPMGAVDTPANRRDMPDFDPARYIDPADIAEALLFAATRSARARTVELPVWPA
jgi:NADP-dependent 3-hydroxy acid dehydrogenase YdfG